MILKNIYAIYYIKNYILFQKFLLIFFEIISDYKNIFKKFLMKESILKIKFQKIATAFQASKHLKL